MKRVFKMQKKISISKKWTQKEVSILRENYKNIPTQDLQLLLYKVSPIIRTLSAIRKAYHRYCPQHTNQFLWKDKHTQILLFNKEKKIHELAFLIGCSAGEIVVKKREFNLSRSYSKYTKEEDSFLLSNPKRSLLEISSYLNRSVPSIKARKALLGITIKKRVKRSIWTSLELQFLKDNYREYTIKDMAIKLNKSPNTINFACMRLNLKKQNQKSWSDFEIEYLKANYQFFSIKDLAVNLNRSFPSVATKLKLIIGEVKKQRITKHKVFK